MLETKISGCAIINDEKILLLHKKKKNYYEFPGGKIELGENRRGTAKRETKEEIGCVVDLREYFGPYIFNNNGVKISHVYIAEIISGTPKIIERKKFDKIKYIPIRKYHKYKLAPNVKMFLKEYLNYIKEI
ncbi:MAG: DNA mismatch repair protein MutT [Candidatus Woesearchaeota archaeon]|nr:MAG: DNA mismatch repair protein MutT [Candidatus Woesearchaeota archaeon]